MSIFHTEDVHLIDYLRVLYKRRVFFVVVVLAALGGTIWSTYRQRPVYSSSARVLVDNEGTLVDFPGVERRSMMRLDTEMHIMRSREVAEHAVAKWLRPGIDRRDPEFEALVNRLMTTTAIDVMKSTLIVEMRSMADDPEKARDFCEAMAESYVEVNFDAKKQANAAAAAAIREEIQKTARDLETSERRLLDFKTEHNLLSARAKEDEAGKYTGSGIAARASADVMKREYEVKYRALARWHQQNDFTLPLPLDLAPTANELYQQIVKKRMEYRGLLSKYREQHPKVQSVQAEMETLRKNFDEEVQNALEGLRKSAEIYSTIGQAHEAGVAKDKFDILKENDRDWQYTVLQRDVDVKQEIYRALLLKLGEINVTTSITKNNVRIIERPKAIPVPIRPNWRFNLLVGLVFGLGVAVAGVFFLEYLDKTLKTPDDISRYLNLPVLAIVPLARSELLRAPYQAPQLRESDPGAITA